MKKHLLLLGLILIVNLQIIHAQECAVGEDQIVIKIDANGNFGAYAFYWSLFDENNNEVISYGVSAYSDITITQDTLCLVNGEQYTFRAFNDFGGGWNENGSSYASIYYGADEFPLYYGSPNNGNPERGEAEVAFTFTVGDRPGIDCSQPKDIDLYEAQLLNTNAFNLNTNVTTFDSGKDVILRFIAPNDDNYKFSVSDVVSPSAVSLQLLSSCIDGTPTVLGSGQSSPSLEPFEFGASLIGGVTYYLLFSNNASTTGLNRAEAKLEISYNGIPASDECGVVTLTMDGAATFGRFAEATPTGSSITINTADGNFYQSANRDIFYDFNLNSLNVVVEIQDYKASGELFAQLSFGGCPSGDLDLKNVTFEGTTRRFNFEINPLDANLGDPVSLVLAEGQFDSYDKPFSISIRSRASVEAEFPINPNSDCSTAANIVVNSIDNYNSGFYPTPLLMSNYNATNSGLVAPCGQDSIYTGLNGDVWAKAIVPASGVMEISVEGEYADLNSIQPLNIAWALYTGNCGALSEYYCSPYVAPYQTDTVGGLTSGEEVFIRLFDRGGLRQGDFSISIQEREVLEQPVFGLTSFIDSIQVEFNEYYFNFDNYLIDVSIDSFATFLPTYENKVLDKSIFQFNITGLLPNTKYFIRAKKVSNNKGDSDYFSDVIKTNPIIINTVASGNWNDPATWEGGVVPTADFGVNIFHRIEVSPGSNITIEEVTIKHAIDASNAIGLFINDADFRVERDIDVLEENNSYSITVDSLGVFISNNSGLNKTFSVGGSISLIADQYLETQFMFFAQNFAGNLNVLIERDFNFNNINTTSFSTYNENIIFEDIELTVESFNIRHNDDIEGTFQTFKALINNSILNVNQAFTIIENTSEVVSYYPFYVYFTGNSTLNLAGNLNKEYAGVIKFLDNSTLELSGNYEQYIASFDPFIGQDSTIINNLVINNTYKGDSDQANEIFENAGVYFTANGSTGNGQFMVNGQLSFLLGISSTSGGLSSESVELILTESATLDPTYSGSNRAYHRGVFTKYGLNDFTYPIGNDYGPRILAVSNLSATLPNTYIKLRALSDACQDSIFNVATGITKARIQDYWLMETAIQEAGITADLTAIFPDRVTEGIGNTSSLRLLDFENGLDLGNTTSTINSFTSNYNFDNGLNKTFGLGSVDAANSFYDTKVVASISSADVVAGDNIVITYAGDYASVNDIVYFEQIPGNTISAISNSITVNIPNGARSGEPVIILENNTILHVDFMVNVRESILKDIIGQQYDSLVLIDNIGMAAFGESKIQISDINNNTDYDFIGIRQGVDSIYFINDLAGERINDYFYFDELSPGEKPAYKDINVTISNAFGNPTVDIAGYVQFFTQQIPVYLFNNGSGNFSIAETEGYGNAPKIRTPFARDINGDGFSDFNFALNGDEIQYNGLYSSLFENETTCNIYAVEAIYARGDKKTVEAISYGNFGEFQQTLSYAYIPSAGELVLTNPHDVENSFVATISVAASLTDFHKASLNNNSKAQYIALDTLNNTIEIFDGFTAGNIQETNVSLPFIPGRMAIEDLNGDGFADIIVSERGTSNLFFYANNTAGNFTLADSLPGALPNIVDLEIADINQDGNRDIVLLLESGDVYVAYFNQLAVPISPVVTASNITTNSFDMSWLPIEGVTTYAIEVSLSSDTTVNLATDSIFYTSDTLITFNAPIPFETFYIHARGLNAALDTSNYATTVQVDLLPLVSPEVLLTAIDANTLELAVTQAEGSNLYQLFISLDADSIANDARDTILTVLDGLTSFIVPEYSEVYYVYARSVASGIDTSNFELKGNIKLPVSPYFKNDSLALVSLFHATEGLNWTDKDGWLTDKVNKWRGITMIGDTIKAIDLSTNNLQNNIPDSLAIMNYLESLNLADNEINSLGNIASLAAQLSFVNVSNNSLSFEDLEILSAASNYQFLGQRYQYSYVKDTLINLTENITFGPEATAVSNSYQWFKNGVLLDGATKLTLSLIGVTKADEGKYNLQINNSEFDGLTLFSDTLDFKVSTLERDIAALKDLHITANGALWSTIKWDTTKVNPADWHANTTDIVIENNRVVEVNLPNNKLSGAVSNKLREILGLRALNFSANDLMALPDLSKLPSLNSLNVSSNQLGYEDLEPNVNINGFSFENQQAIGIEITEELAVGSAYTISYALGGKANTYQWYRNDEMINGQQMDSIFIDSLIYDNMGSYQLRIKNALINAKFPEFELQSAYTNVYATANVSGRITDRNGFATTSGQVNLFEITPEGAYDSVRFEGGKTAISLQSDGTYQINNLRLGDYILFVKPNQSSFPQLLSTYYPNTIDWDVADELFIRNHVVDIDVIMEGTPQALNGTSSFSGYVELEVPASKEQRLLPRQRISGTGVSVRRLGNSNKSVSKFNGELVAFIETDENGEFNIPNLPAGDYICKVDYPGIPMNESSDIRFTLTGENLESLKVAAVVDNGVCTVETILYTSVEKPITYTVHLYPNPFNDIVNIQGDIEDLSEITILDIKGQFISQLKVGQHFNNKIDLSNFASGVYIIQLNWKSGMATSSKIVKN